MRLPRLIVVAIALLLLTVPLAAQDRPTPLPSPVTLIDVPNATDAILNGGFETDSDWTELSLQFPSDIICSLACGTGGDTAGPRTGDGFIWFGGSSQEASILSQSLTLTPEAGLTDVLIYHLWNGTSRRGVDRFYASYQGLQLAEIVEGTKPFDTGYAPIYANLTGFIGGDLSFLSTSMDGAITNFSLDDVSLITNVPQLVTNESFEASSPAPDGWTTPGKSQDKVVCNSPSTPTPFGLCSYQFKGSATENSKLVQVMTAPTALATNDTLLAAFWANVEPKTILNATLTVNYKNGTNASVKINASYKTKYDDASASTLDVNRQWKLYQLPPLVLTRPAKNVTLTILHKSKAGTVTVNVDNISVAQLVAPIP